MRQFRYLRDPLFLFAFAAFLINRFALEQIWTSGFVHNHVNDLLCVAFLVPVMLTLMKCCGLRRFDGPPRTAEIVIPILVWGLFFEVLLPLHPFWGRWATADPADILCYWIGGLAAAMVWRRTPSVPAQVLPDDRSRRLSHSLCTGRNPDTASTASPPGRASTIG